MVLHGTPLAMRDVRVETQEGGAESREPDEAVVEAEEPEGGTRVADVETVLEQLVLGRVPVPGQLLLSDALLRVSRGGRGGFLPVHVELVQAGEDVATQSGEPELGRRLTDGLVVLQGDELCAVRLCHAVSARLGFQEG